MIHPFYKSKNRDFTLVLGDCLEVLGKFDFAFDLVFADPPYFLSSGGISVQAGRRVCVDKGIWDKPRGREAERAFTYAWLKAVRDKLAPDGTIWISGTFHNIFLVAEALEALGFRLLNAVTWQKTNPPPNLSCRCLTHATETILWARKSAKIPHRYNYELMRAIAGGRQLTDIWHLPAIAPWEKANGVKHPTQKPLAVLVRLLLAATAPNSWVLDPFCGSGTTGVAANVLGRRFLGIDSEPAYLQLARARREALNQPGAAEQLRARVAGFEASMLTLEEIVKQEKAPPTARETDALYVQID